MLFNASIYYTKFLLEPLLIVPVANANKSVLLRLANRLNQGMKLSKSRVITCIL